MQPHPSQRKWKIWYDHSCIPSSRLCSPRPHRPPVYFKNELWLIHCNHPAMEKKGPVPKLVSYIDLKSMYPIVFFLPKDLCIFCFCWWILRPNGYRLYPFVLHGSIAMCPGKLITDLSGDCSTCPVGYPLRGFGWKWNPVHRPAASCVSGGVFSIFIGCIQRCTKTLKVLYPQTWLDILNWWAKIHLNKFLFGSMECLCR
jgi:hypothetical protein